MRFQPLLLLSSAASVLATPTPQGTGTGADSCPVDPLTADTWTKLNIDQFLEKWVQANFTAPAAGGSSIQALAATFGAPNFFCGLDAFCNAGQPCLPVTPPAWYVMVGIQNWNNYMNSVNTAVSFASSILSLKLPGIVSDFLPDPVDNVTPIKDVIRMFTTVLGAVPLTGPIATGRNAVNGGLNFLLGSLTPPAGPDKFVQWSNVASTLASVVTDYQSTVSSTFDKILQADPLDASFGIDGLLTGGNFLGVTQNFTASDLQTGVDAALTLAAVSAAVAASGTYVLHFHNAQPCRDDDVSVCQQNGSSNINLVLKHKDFSEATDTAATLTGKYNISKDEFLVSVADCWNSHGQTNLFTAFNESLPVDASTPCLFYIPVCDLEPGNLLPGADTFSTHCDIAVTR
ncbi:hypothetical protein NLU13_3676 [Sarocladium strictum]|uniref:DUF7872 domain-containing protein n=1 Tax=Sarocladium strictum TaxID=5046 RepID=A0AA39GNW8_SARSR|nr:hypothetical protein NLU13_3676 [Sarocladium strictum]